MIKTRRKIIRSGRYKKKPVIIEAIQWFEDGDHPQVSMHDPNPTDIPYYRPGECPSCGISLYRHGSIKTLEGDHIVCPGDMIIKGIKGEYYPCKPDIFIESYDFCE